MSFTHKKLTPAKRVCLRLKGIREAAGVSIGEMCERTKLRKAYIHALESCAFHELPKGLVYQKNFIKLYLEALGIDPSNYIRQFLLEEDVPENERAHPHTPFRSFHFHSLPSLIRQGALAAILFIAAWYLGWQIHTIVTAPRLQIYTPENGHITHEQRIAVRGSSEKETAVTVNGKTVIRSDEGLFQETVDLTPGVNTIIITATKKHGKTASDTRYVTYREPPAISLSKDAVDNKDGT